MHSVQPRPQRARGVVLSMCAVAVALFTGCAVTTPGCDTAGGLLDSARLDEAAIAYASADLAGEGDCAASGLAAAVAANRDVAVAIARGRLAEERQDREAALAAYRTAVEIDSGSEAVESLRRLGADPPEIRPAQARPPANTATLVFPWWPLAVVGILIAGAVGVGVWWTLVVLQAGRKAADVRVSIENARTELASIQSGLSRDHHADERTGTAGRLATLDDRLHEVKDALASLATGNASGQDRLERQIDDVAEQLDDLERANGQTSRCRFIRDDEEDA